MIIDKPFKCHLCSTLFPLKADSMNDRLLFAYKWIPLQQKIFCSSCAPRALALAVETLIKTFESHKHVGGREL